MLSASRSRSPRVELLAGLGLVAATASTGSSAKVRDLTAPAYCRPPPGRPPGGGGARPRGRPSGRCSPPNLLGSVVGLAHAASLLRRRADLGDPVEDLARRRRRSPSPAAVLGFQCDSGLRATTHFLERDVVTGRRSPARGRRRPRAATSANASWMASRGWHIVRATPSQTSRGLRDQRTRSRNRPAWTSSWTARASAGRRGDGDVRRHGREPGRASPGSGGVSQRIAS